MMISLAGVRMEQALTATEEVTVPQGEWEGDDLHQASLLARTLADGDNAAAQTLLDQAYRQDQAAARRL